MAMEELQSLFYITNLSVLSNHQLPLVIQKG